MRSILLGAAIALALSACTSNQAAHHAVTATSTNEAAAAASLISAYRVANGLSPVTVDQQLNRAAEQQARAVAEAGRLSHGNFGERMGRYGIAGYAAENLSAGQDTVAEAVKSWKESRLHNGNLLMPEAGHIGLARADSQGGFGHYWSLVLGQ
jgi:uncharacterized protein YkwD